MTVSENEGASADLTLASTTALDVSGGRQAARGGAHQHPADASAPRPTSSPGRRSRASRAATTTRSSQVLLQAPGVTQDSSDGGYIHVRNEHANVQYRINGVALPEGVSLFGQSGGLSPRLASKVDLITGALPAEYGLRTGRHRGRADQERGLRAG